MNKPSGPSLEGSPADRYRGVKSISLQNKVLRKLNEVLGNSILTFNILNLFIFKNLTRVEFEMFGKETKEWVKTFDGRSND